MNTAKNIVPRHIFRFLFCGLMPIALSMQVALAATAQATAPTAPVTTNIRGLPDFSDLVEQAGPSVVNIRTTEKLRRNENLGGAADPDEQMQELLRRFFGAPMPGQPQQRPDSQRQRRGMPQPQEPQEVQRGVGSGFIITSDGFIMTNAHVVEGAESVIVTLTDKREFKARIIGSDKRTDVAVVKIQATGLPAVKIGDVNRLRVGEWVIAIGSPFGLENTVTAGIVSAKQRDTGEYLPFIQTDVAINPGNSGGPLINMRGEVVGINSQIYSRSGGFMGISFSIPIDEAIHISDQLRANGRVQRGRIGVQIEPVSKELSESLGLNKAQGALVRAVEADSPADKAGIEAGDVILRVDNNTVEKAADLPRQIGSIKPGSRAVLQVWRRGNAKNISVTVGEFEAEKTAANHDADEADKSAETANSELLGLTITALNTVRRNELKIKGGVLVEAVKNPAARFGIREGDVLVAIGNDEINSIKDFEKSVARLEKGRPVSIVLRRGNWSQFVVIRPGSATP
jgi:serine protease Do